jgi:hypothetical protein
LVDQYDAEKILLFAGAASVLVAVIIFMIRLTNFRKKQVKKQNFMNPKSPGI